MFKMAEISGSVDTDNVNNQKRFSVVPKRDLMDENKTDRGNFFRILAPLASYLTQLYADDRWCC